MLSALKKLRPSQMAIIAGVAVALVAGGIGIGTAVNDNDGGGQRLNAPFGRDFRHGGGPGGPGFRRGGPGGPSAPGFRPGPRGQYGGPGLNPNLSQVLSDVRQAIAKDALKAAGPILDEAVKDKKITKAEADMIRGRITQPAQGGGPGRGGF